MKKEKNSEYLIEDKDLLNELDGLHESSTGLAGSRMMHKLIALQIKASLRNRKTADNFDKSTARYSLILIGFALTQLSVAIYQFLFEAEFSNHPYIGFFYFGAIVIIIICTFRQVSKVI
ncbi:MAG: hypothetical protein P4L67_00315 [Candidatus Pacebacteria bacterium]|nr:hypothetical protein [Candidatus Paceibacterota bacterium]